MGLKERVVKYLEKHPGAIDGDIAKALHQSHAKVFGILLDLEREGKMKHKSPKREVFWHVPLAKAKKFLGIK
jgi:hypothetical protein